MRYELTLADQAEGRRAYEASPTGDGGHDYLTLLRAHPLARAELGRPQGVDHVHLSQIDGTDIVVWMGRQSNGFHRPIGRWMRLVAIHDYDTLTALLATKEAALVEMTKVAMEAQQTALGAAAALAEANARADEAEKQRDIEKHFVGIWKGRAGDAYERGRRAALNDQPAGENTP